MYQAFEPALLLERLPVKVECLAHHRQTLYVGTATGVVLVYRISSVPEGEKPAYVDEFGEKFGIQLVRSVKGFSKRSIEHMEVVPELSLLLAQTDGQVNAYDLPTLQFQASLAPPSLLSRGGLKFSSFTGIALLAPKPLGEKEMGPSPQATPTLTTRVAISSKRLIVMLTWVDGEFASDRTQEFSIADRAKSLEFMTADSLWIGLSNKEYWILDMKSGALTEAVPSAAPPPPSSSSDPAKPSSPTPAPATTSGVTSLFTDLAYTSTQYVTSYNPLGSMRGAQPRPIMLRLTDQEMIVAKGEVGLFAGPDGAPTRRTAIHFPAEPQFLGYSYPYLLIASAKQVEVRNLDSQAAVQTQPLPSGATPVAFTRGKSPFMATSNQIWRWVPSHFADQINKLIQLKLFEEALTLLEQNRDRVSEVQTCSASQIRELYALDLFQQGQFDRALTMILDLKLPPHRVISLYPAQISGIGKEDESLMPREGNEPYHQIADGSNWPQPRLLDAVQALVKYLTQTRTQLAPKLQNWEGAQEDLELKIIEATLVDTTLVRSYLVTNHAMIGPLLRVRNYVDVQIADKLLGQHKKYRELVDLYYSKGLHRKSLQLLVKLGRSSSDEDTPKAFLGVGPTVQYLERLGGENFDLIAEFVPWCLEIDSELTMGLFLDDHISSETLPAQGVLNLLERHQPELAMEYLYHILPSHYVERPAKAPHPTPQGADSPDFHNTLAFLYIDQLLHKLEKIVTSSSELGFSPPSKELLALELEMTLCHPRREIFWEKIFDLDDKNDVDESIQLQAKELCDNFDRLSKFLLADPPLYKPERVLGRLPAEMLLKPRAIVLSRLNRHDQALSMLVHRLQDLTGAEEYCLRINTQQVFMVLLKVYLQDDNPDHLDPALQLLDRHGARIDATQALELLPLSVKMNTLGGFFTQNLRSLISYAHSKRIALNILKSESVRLSHRLVELKQNPIQLDSTTLCPVCLKKIGTSAFAIYPDRKVVHYSCQSNKKAADISGIRN